MANSSSSPFDDPAAGYDATFTESSIGREMRAIVWRRFDALFRPGMRILELNCGTGEDAVHLASRGVDVTATDSSAAMLALAERKAARSGVSGLLRFKCLAIERLGEFGHAGAFHGVVSNFGGLNCVENVAAAARAIHACLAPNGIAVLCVMGRYVPWEWLWYLAHGDVARAFRRLHRKGVPWRGITVRYPSPGKLERTFAPWLQLERASAVGLFVPPTYGEAFVRRHPRMLRTLSAFECRAAGFRSAAWLADHYLAEFRKRPD